MAQGFVAKITLLVPRCRATKGLLLLHLVVAKTGRTSRLEVQLAACTKVLGLFSCPSHALAATAVRIEHLEDYSIGIYARSDITLRVCQNRNGL